MEKTLQTNELRSVNWAYLPDVNTLSEYLYTSNLIELSKCCKLYRTRLIPKIFSKLKLITKSSVLDDSKIFSRNLGRLSSSEIINLLQLELNYKLGFVREVDLNIFITKLFAAKFIALFPNIKKLRISNDCHIGNLSSLSTVIHGLKHLTHVEFSIGNQATVAFDTSDQVLPKSLKLIKVDLPPRYVEIDSIVQSPKFLPIFDTIDFSYTNLTTLTITSNKMLANLNSTMPNLKRVELLNCSKLNYSNFLEFINNNPQLIKLKTEVKLEDSIIIREVLSLKYLKELTIKGKSDFYIGDNLPLNKSIKRLNLSNFTNVKNCLKMINACQSVEIIMFNSFDFSYITADLEWSKLNRKFNTFYYNNCSFMPDYLQFLDDSQIFNRANFFHSSRIENFTYVREYNWKNYELNYRSSFNQYKFSIEKL